MAKKQNKKQAILLASGGLDSCVLGFYIKNKLKYNKIKILFFDYGQKTLEQETYCVKTLAKKIKAKIKIINLRWLGNISTSLINKNKKTGKQEVIKWYVPCRNTLFLSAALAEAESDFLKSKEKIKNDIFIGVKYEGEISFNDTKPAFIEAINNLSKVCVQSGVFQIKAPFINKDKEDIIELGNKLGVDYSQTYSCYLGGNLGKEKTQFIKINNKKIPIHCGKCAGCLERKKGFKFSYIKDESFYLKD